MGDHIVDFLPDISYQRPKSHREVHQAMMDGTIAKSIGAAYLLSLELMPSIIINFIGVNYYLLLSPFRIYYDPVCKKFIYRRHSNVFNGFLIVFQCFCPLYFILIALLRKDDSPSQTVDKFLSDAITALWLTVNAINKWYLWTQATQTLGMLNYLLKTTKKFKQNTRISKIPILVLIGLLLHLPQILSTVAEIQDSLVCSTVEMKDNKTQCEVHMGQIIELIAVLHEDLASTFGATYSLLASLTMLALARSIQSKISERSGKKEILDNCKSYIRLNLWMRKCTGTLVSASCLGLLLYYTQKLQQLFSLPANRFFQVVVYAFIQSACLICGAMAGSVMSSLPRTLMVSPTEASFHARSDRTGWEEVAILHTVNTDGIGLKTRTFVTTYAFLGNILGIVTTYAITLVQMQQQSSL